MALQRNFNRKRSHDDLEDGDECLPISKRIHSLHIEGHSAASQITPFEGQSSGYADNQSEITTVQGYISVDNGNCQSRLMPVPELPRMFEQEPGLAYHGRQQQPEGEGSHPYLVPASATSSGQPSSSHHSPAHTHSFLGHQSLGEGREIFSNGSQPSHNGMHPSSVLEAHFASSTKSSQFGQPLAQSHPVDGSQGLPPGNPFYPQLSPSQNAIESQAGSSYPGCYSNHHQQQQHQHQHYHNHYKLLQQQELVKESLNADFLSHDSRGDSGATEDASNFDMDQMPSGIYEPELDAGDNPFYYSVNQMLYEAHVSRLRRLNQFSCDSGD